MFYLKAFAGTMLALLAVNYALTEGAKQVMGPAVEQAAANAQALDGGAIPVASDQLAPAEASPSGWDDSGSEDW